MPSPTTESHRAKTQNLAELCRDAALLPDLRIQGYLARSLAIMASAYIEISVREEVAAFCQKRSHPLIGEFVRSTIEYENSLNCSKIERILGLFDKKIWDTLRGSLSAEQISAIDSLKALRDQIAHGKDNNTGYLVIARYFHAVADFPTRLAAALDAA